MPQASIPPVYAAPLAANGVDSGGIEPASECFVCTTCDAREIENFLTELDEETRITREDERFLAEPGVGW
jgi:hypothetical protein